ncbi:hypothetical protein Pla100_30000 [Neorhodopirellula pilleata]|uniref:Uncharacterized protein n=1 Tax=Neorhodopirellula pilleata TaxID=2714738 RepID=A0A5C6AAX1_9BACT|nr:hypothetical protein Pla100_30000 [Neorhodopirellula pilleata]
MKGGAAAGVRLGFRFSSRYTTGGPWGHSTAEAIDLAPCSGNYDGIELAESVTNEVRDGTDESSGSL